ncbi:halocyanin domain-containing protein [Halorientalis brevis]|uniref:Halocyanin domain-containing protein n=1 Tax=Halorientalis brevis TaxID=1126241 RepID=A0ABD6C7T6_9EURY|nr:halocyanin domain-containing protein [Halorientalis brevis]
MDDTRRQTLQSLAGLATGLAVAGCIEQSTRAGDDADDVPESTGDSPPTDTATVAARERSPGAPDLGGYLDDANNYDGIVADETGQQVVTVQVGAGDPGLAFGPAAVHVDNGATVTWEWTGEGGAHTVVAEDGTFDSGNPVAEAGVNFEHTFERDGIYPYYCNPHKASGMLGAVVVGTDYPTVASHADSTPTEPRDEPPAEQSPSDAPTTTESEASGYDGYLDDVAPFDGVADATDASSATVTVGAGDAAFAFDPPALRVTTETTVTWKWNGEGGAHNVVAEDGSFDSESPVAEAGVHFEHTFDETGVYKYYCAPHKALEMKGVVEVVA